MPFAAIHIPEFPVAAWLCREPLLKHRPLVVLQGMPPHEQVASVNAVAKALGISHSMSRVQAEAICAAKFRRRDLENEKQAFSRVVAIAKQFAPRIQAIAAPANNYANQDRLSVVLLLDCSGTNLLFGDLERYTQRVHQELAAAGYASGVAAAPNGEAALMLARSTDSSIGVTTDRLREHLAALPTSLLPCDANALSVLQRWGIRTLGQLARLPEEGLVSRLGQSGLRLQQLARGEATCLLVPDEPALAFSEQIELDSPLETLESLLFVLSRLLGNVLSKAAYEAYAIRKLTIILTLERMETQVVRVMPAVPTQNRDALLHLLGLELQAHPPPAEVVAARMEAEPAQSQVAQRGLFQSQFPDPDRLDLLLARLHWIAGQENVGSPVLSNTYREDAFLVAPFRPALNESAPAVNESLRPMIRMLRPAQPVRVQIRQEKPHAMWWRGLQLVITEAAGPWYASSSWWDHASFDCEYWDVVTEEPLLVLRLLHGSQQWNVVGLYD